MNKILDRTILYHSFCWIILFAGCGSAPQLHDVKKNFLLPGVDRDAAWTAIVGIFAEQNWNIVTLEADSGIIVSEWLKLRRDQGEQFADCGITRGFLFLPEEHRGRSVKFNLFLRRVGQDLQLVVNTSFRELREEDNRQFYFDCTSLGTLEAYLFGEVSKQLAIGLGKR